VTFVVLAWSLVELAGMALNHTVGPEAYAIIVPAVAVIAAAAGMTVLWTGRRRMLATAAILVLWAIVGLGGIAGTYYHAVGVAPEYGPVDPRPRPAGTPLLFVALALAGGAAVVAGQRGIATVSKGE
jgi:hypothetical protein